MQIVPHLVVRNASRAMDFYKMAFNAIEIVRIPTPDEKLIMHAEMRIEDARFYLCDEMPGMESCQSPSSLGASSVMIQIWTDDMDKLYDRATSVGARPIQKPADMFWGDRYAILSDPFGHQWSLATKLKDMTPEEIRDNARKFFQTLEE